MSIGYQPNNGFQPVTRSSTVASKDETATSVVNVQVNDVGASQSTNEKDNRNEIRRLRSSNEVYSMYRPLWDFYLASYEGGDAFANGDNLFRHPREHPDDFLERSKRIFYHNFCFPLVDFFTTFIYTETIQRDGGANKDFYTPFVGDVNRKGDDITAFMTNISDDVQVYGIMYVLVDTPPKPERTDGAPVTQADEAANGIRPYWVPIRPDEVLDWVVDEFDKFTYLKRQEVRSQFDESTMKTRTIERYTEWTPTSIYISEIDVSDNRPRLLGKTNVVNELGKIPIEVIRFKRSKLNKFLGESFLRDLAFMSREVMNLTSLLQEFLYRQCFNILAMPEDNNLSETESMQGEIGTANMLRYPQGSHAPQYLTPPVQPAQFLQSEREATINAMYRIAAQDTVNELFNGGKSSGFSKSQSFQRTVPKIATRADALEDMEMRLMSLTMEYVGKKWDGTVKYKDHYEVTNLADSLQQMGTLFKDLQIQSKTFASTQLKRMVAEFDGKLSPDDRARVEKEIDAINWDEWFATQKLAFVGRADAAPVAGEAFGVDPATAGGKPSDPSAPVKGKDTATSPTTPQRPQGTSKEIQAESRSK